MILQFIGTGEPVEIESPGGLPATIAISVQWRVDHADGCYYIVDFSGTLDLNGDCIQYDGYISGTITYYDSVGVECDSEASGQSMTLLYRYCHTAYGNSVAGCKWAFCDWAMPYLATGSPIGTYIQGIEPFEVNPQAYCDCALNGNQDVTVTMEIT